MQSGNRGKGRPKGSPNKRKTNLSIAKFLDDKGIVPIEELMQLMPELRPEEQAKIWLKLQEYVEPKAMVPIQVNDDSTDQLQSIPSNNLVSIIRPNGNNP